MAWLREQGYTVDKVEHRQAFTRKTLHDLFGFADVVAIKAGEPGVLAAQCTTVDHMLDRQRKIFAEPRALLWLACGNRIQVIGWHRVPASPGATRTVWAPAVHKVLVATVCDLDVIAAGREASVRAILPG